MVKLILTFSDHMLYWLSSTKLAQNITPKKACQFQQSTKSSPMDMEENDLLFGTYIFFIKYNLNVDFVIIKWNRPERCCFVYYQLTGLTIILMFFQDCFWHKIEKKNWESWICGTCGKIFAAFKSNMRNGTNFVFKICSWIEKGLSFTNANQC